MTKKKVKEEFPPIISDEIRKKMEKAGYKSVKSLLLSFPEDLAAELNIGIDLAESMIELAREETGIQPMTADEIFQDELNRNRLTTGSNSLDSLLEGGIWEKEITELSGNFASGKTQLCFQLAVNAQLSKDRGGLEGKVFYIDTEGTFSAKRVAEMALGNEMDPQKVLRNIYVGKALDTDHQLKLIKKVAEIATEENIKLVIVDSLAAHFRTDYIDKERLPERQQKIMQQGSLLATLAFTYGMAVVVTNQVVARVDDFATGGASQPALGQAWAHRPQTRILLRKSPGLARIARLFDSPRKPESEEIFYITADGIRDRPLTL